MISLDFTVNGKHHQIDVDPRLTLLEVLRENLLLTGTKEGCGVGECGTCVVLSDGEPVTSCLILAGDAHGAAIETVEGLAVDGELNRRPEGIRQDRRLPVWFLYSCHGADRHRYVSKTKQPDVEQVKKDAERHPLPVRGLSQDPRSGGRNQRRRGMTASVGTRAPRVDSVEKVTGGAVYGVDVQIAGTLHGAVAAQSVSPRPDRFHRHHGGRSCTRGRGRGDRTRLSPAVWGGDP